jgi:ATP adenylyltransferase
MTYQDLADFIQNRMRMSHIYQPVMLTTLLLNKGSCPERTIAEALLGKDESQIEYYQKVTRDMVGRVLRNHGIVERNKKQYTLTDFRRLSEDQIKTLIGLCEDRLQEYLKKRGATIWEHRRKSSGYISGTVRYEVLKRAKFHCDLCGIAADQKALEVDHILPRSKGGNDDLSNFQALCYSCNPMKRDRDDTDFHAIRESLKKRQEGCVFCEIKKGRIVRENKLAYAVRDLFPVVEGHTLIIPKPHLADYFELGQSQVNACTRLLHEVKNDFLLQDPQIKGFNIGINNGEVSGQTIFHCHIHLIPRREGDVENPRGGIRHMIPGKGDYFS